ncbi:magnesium transporter CorA family protein [Ramlibacter tataouinensis]|uniref:Candidate Mg2+ and Co2+ transporter n=1 Tax=Ramlibacter tataouinensis (strain ATCC BAA-407 / DSM 14655 / LMG 21543 / TTB310) TaxID=365046 RepID=F5Y4R6_RAMTT|nr:magnesium transporter CorA family protein [Ramlibacter tataouinensis]AEG91384.1 Candidate Mg2+ and Co2+ transporter [Ramlibacter tataouinensis TTB310]
MQIVEVAGGTLRFLEAVPAQVPADGFVWIYLDRESLAQELPALQQAAQRLGGSALLDLHVQDLENPAHPSHYDYTSVYDLMVFRRLATEAEARAEIELEAAQPPQALAQFHRIRSRAVGFVVFDRLLVSVHPGGCFTAKSFLQRYLSDALYNDGLTVATRSRLPATPSDLMLRMVNVMVDSYLELRKQLSAEMDRWQQELLLPQASGADWNALLAARSRLHSLENLCEEQNDAMQEWLDNLLEQPWPGLAQADRDALIARSRDVIEHIQRVVHHVRRMEQGAETVVQIHFSAQSQRTNDIMRVLTALTAIFLPLNLVTGVFGMNFELMPLVGQPMGFWVAVAGMVAIALALAFVFRRKRYLARTGR